ncbi:MAG: hypothetical protein WD512_07690 [Candidatus Paceibacterota bacterium]
MSETTLVKLGYNKIDKLCDATFIRKIFKSTKKDFALFVSENPDLQSFFEGLEAKIDETNVEYQSMIEEYLESIQEDINVFKLNLKELEREKKQEEKERQKEQMRQEILKEMEAEKRKAELESKIGILKPKAESGSDEKESSGLKFKSKLKLRERPEENTDKSIKPIDKLMTEVQKPSTTFDQATMDLGLFFVFLKEVIKKDLLIIKSDQGRMTIKDIDLDDDKIRVKVSQ